MVKENNEDRPDPEALLQAIKKLENKNKDGKFKLFFGMSAGVGKTYTMLEDALQRQQEGVDVVCGIINTHGRKETAAIAEKLPFIPEKTINYKGSYFSELDIDAILTRKPQLVLIDELAHTNVPGSRHHKRWQDVLEILEAGIDVYSTLNVQHIESRKDVIEEIAGITIRETVPDLVFERANQIELVDITPVELLKRLKEGKVYLGPQSEIAAKNFFQVDRLTALREIALRLTAEKVDHDLHGLLPNQESTSKWRPGEKLMVAVSHSPHSQSLIRTTRRYAFTLDAPWVAVHVDTGKKLSLKDNEQLVKNLSLARELGAEIVSVVDTDIGTAIQRVAQQKHVTQIIMGRPQRRLLGSLFNQRTLIDQLNEESSDIDIHIIRKDSAIPPYNPSFFNLKFTGESKGYLLSFLAIFLVGAVSSLLSINYIIVGFLFLLTILLLSLFNGSGPLLFSAATASLVWGFLFIPVTSNNDIFDFSLFISFFAAAIITGVLSQKIQERERLLRSREERTKTLYEIVKEIASAPSRQALFEAVCKKLDATLNGETYIFLTNEHDELVQKNGKNAISDEKEMAVAIWSKEHGNMAGFSTNTLSSANNLYIPLKGFKEIVGVLAFKPTPTRSLQPEEINLLQTTCQQLAAYIERTTSEDKVRNAEYMQQIEKIQHTILASISKEFNEPLFSIKGAAKDLKKPEFLGNIKLQSRKIQQIEDSSNNLSHIVDNVLAMSKLNSGFLKIHKDSHDIKELIEACLINLSKTLEKHSIEVSIAEELPSIQFDFSLMELLLCNLLINAAEYSPLGAKIRVSARMLSHFVLLSVADSGKGIPPDYIHLVFQKFYRIPGTEQQGVGLGLAVVKTIADMHNGKIEVRNRQEGGVEFILYLPK